MSSSVLNYCKQGRHDLRHKVSSDV